MTKRRKVARYAAAGPGPASDSTTQCVTNELPPWRPNHEDGALRPKAVQKALGLRD